MKTFTIILFFAFTAILLYGFWPPSLSEGLFILAGSYVIARFVAGITGTRFSDFFQKPSTEK